MIKEEMRLTTMKKQTFVILILSTFVFSGCDTLRNTFGLDHYQADDFAVTQNPSLSVPPDYALVPPNPNAKNPGEVLAADQAQQTVLGGKKPTLYKTSQQAESTLISTAGKGKVIDANIREKIDEDAKNDNPLMNKLTSLKNEVKRNLSGPALSTADENEDDTDAHREDDE